MTIICTQITSKHTIHATDSLLTRSMKGEIFQPVEAESGKAKIILVPKFRGAMSWWGRVRAKVTDTKTGELERDWNAREWLLARAENSKEYEEHECQRFAEDLASEMDHYLRDVLMERDEGIGIHFTAYEKSPDEDWIPELFLITNYTGITTGGGYPAGQEIMALRQTYHSLSQRQDTEFSIHGEEVYRLRVLHDLQFREDAVYTYNNGHVVQFNKSRLSLDTVMNIAKEDTYDYLKQRPSFIVNSLVDAQEKFRSEDKRAIGHPCHDLIIEPEEEFIYSSTDSDVTEYDGFDLV